VPILRDRHGRTTVIEKRGPKDLPLELRLIRDGFPRPELEYRAMVFQARHWRFDYAWPDQMVALEVDGGVYTQGRHTRGAGFEEDCRKMNTAAAVGWLVFRVTPQMLQREWPQITHLLRVAFGFKRETDAKA
jgi:hypothetical protein